MSSSLLEFRIGDECLYADPELGHSVTCDGTAVTIDQWSQRPIVGVSLFKDELTRVYRWLYPDRLEIVLRSRGSRRSFINCIEGGVA